MTYIIEQVDGSDPDIAAVLHGFNAMVPDIFPPLAEHHLCAGHWWLVYRDEKTVAFAGMVTFEPFEDTAYFKRCCVMPDDWGHGLQLRLMFVREVKARELGYTRIVSECAEDSHSNLNFRRAHFEMFEPEQRWGAPGSIYWRKTL